MVCGVKHAPSMMLFHHPEGVPKHGCVGKLPPLEALAEARRCVVVCRECHTRLHRGMPALV